MPGVITICTKNSERDRKRVRVERKKIRLDWFFPPMPSKERGNLYPRTKFKCHSQKATCNETVCGTERDVIYLFIYFPELIMSILLFFYFGIIWFSEVSSINNYSGESRSFITSENQALFLWWRTTWTPIPLFYMLHI